jgi:hypothetical protein
MSGQYVSARILARTETFWSSVKVFQFEISSIVLPHAIHLLLRSSHFLIQGDSIIRFPIFFRKLFHTFHRRMLLQLGYQHQRRSSSVVRN